MATTTLQRQTGQYVQRSGSSGLYEVLDLILDKGLVVDVFVRVSLIGIEILTVDARIVIASVDTYLRFAEAVNRLDLMATETSGLPELMEDITEDGSKSKTKGVLEGAKEKLFGDSDDDDDDDGSGNGRQRSKTPRGRAQAKRRASSRSSS